MARYPGLNDSIRNVRKTEIATRAIEAVNLQRAIDRIGKAAGRSAKAEAEAKTAEVARRQRAIDQISRKSYDHNSH